MNRILVVTALSFLFQSAAQSADRSHAVEVRQVVLTDRGSHEDVSYPDFDFRMDVVGDSDGLKTERVRNGRPWIAAQAGESYSVRLYNPLPVRVAVNLTVDGLNTLTGQPSGIKDGAKWLIEPNSFIELRGWQVNGSESRRFFFTDKPSSYAQWRQDQTGKPVAANVGVIGAAYFWSQKELDAYYASMPVDERTPVYYPTLQSNRGAAALSAPANALSAEGIAAAREMTLKKAATGMGERESHPTTEVAFDYDRGMYRAKDAITIFYDFESTPTPNPFPAIDYAPEMPMER